jgi:hypothetical protein
VAGRGFDEEDRGMRTLFGVARRLQTLAGRAPLLRRAVADGASGARVRPLAAGRRPLLRDGLGEQRRGGVRLDQVDGTTCGSAVLIALAAWADPAEVTRLDGVQTAAAGAAGAVTTASQTGIAPGFGARYDARQRLVHRQSNRFWPHALGTTPWGMTAWLRRYAPAAGPYRVRLVDDTSYADVSALLTEAGGALAAGHPVPLLVGNLIPRHYVMALRVLPDGEWAVYEPSSGHVRALDVARVRARRLGLGFDRLHAALLPA